MKELEDKIKSHILNKKITDIGLYNINDSYFEFDPVSKWVIDGGFQINFDNEIFSFGWDKESEGFDYSLEKSVDKIIGETPHYEIGAKQVDGISCLIGSVIEDVSFKWQFYQVYNDEGELQEENIHVPVEFILKFQTGDFIQFSLILFRINKDPFELIEVEYDLAGRLLVSLNNEIEITNSNNS